MTVHVKITARTFPLSYAVAASRTVFAFTGPFWDASDILVYKDGALQSAGTYSVTGLNQQDGVTITGAYGGGTVTLNSPVTNCTIVIDRFVQAIRDSDFSATGPLSPDAINSDLDKLTARDQDIMANLVGGGGGNSTILSVNGQTGPAVILVPGSIGAAAEHHSHDISETWIASPLTAKMDKAGGTFTGAVLGVTPSAGDNSTKLPTTAWVQTEIAALAGGVTLASSGTPADLGVAARGTGLTAARSDHVHKIPTLSDLAAAGVDLTNVSTSDLRTAIIAAKGLVLNSGDTGKTVAAITANYLLAADGSKNLVWLDPASLGGGGVAGVTTVNGAAGVVTITAAGLGAVPQTALKTVSSYGTLNDNNIADNKATIDLFVADSSKTGWVGDAGNKTLYSTNALTSIVNKRFTGRTKMRITGNNLPGDFMMITTAPTKGSDSGVLYDFSGDLSFGDPSYRIIGSLADNNRVRVGVTEQYFEAAVTPRWQRLQVNSGYSGWGSKVAVAAAHNDTSITMDTTGAGFTYDGVNVVNAFPTGATVKFWAGQNNDGEDSTGFPGEGIVHTAVVTGWNALTGVLQFDTGAPVGGIPLTITTSKGTYDVVAAIGKRTHATANFIDIDHNAAGDGGCITLRGNAGYPGRTGQRHTYHRSTMGLIHGEVTASRDGVYINTLESIHEDNGHDVMGRGFILNFVRDNNTQAYGNVWTGIYMQSTGLKPLNNFFYPSGKADIGLDFTGAAFGAAQRAFALAVGQRIGLDDSQTNGVYGNIRGYSDVVGGSHISARANGELDARGKRIEFVVNNNLSGASYGTLNIRGAAIEAHRTINVYKTDGTLAQAYDPTVGITLITGDISLSAGSVNTSTSYKVAGTKVIGPRAGSIPDATLDLSSCCATLNALIAVFRATGGHGLIAD